MKIISIDNNVGKKIRLPQDTTAVTIFIFLQARMLLRYKPYSIHRPYL